MFDRIILLTSPVEQTALSALLLGQIGLCLWTELSITVALSF